MAAGAHPVGMGRLSQSKSHGSTMIEPHKVMRLIGNHVGLMTVGLRWIQVRLRGIDFDPAVFYSRNVERKTGLDPGSGSGTCPGSGSPNSDVSGFGF
jgi:hypothetical protein